MNTISSEKRQGNLYLKNEDLVLAGEKFFDVVKIPVPREKYNECPVIESHGFITQRAVFAKISSPYYNASAMDGICVNAMEMLAIDERNPKILRKDTDFNFVDTGEAIQDSYNAVVMIEDVVILDDEHVKINNPVALGQHIRPIGEDILAGKLIIPANHQIRPMDIGALLAGGIQKVFVLQKPKVGIIPTGAGLIDDPEDIAIGKTIDSNTYMFAGLVTEYGGIPKRYSPIIDDYDVIKSSIVTTVNENDIVLISGGTLAGKKDYTRKLIEELGEVVIHGVAIQPGKPVVLGIIQGKPVIGIPGYPVSAYFIFENFVKRLIGELNNQLDEKTGVYNLPLLKQYLSANDVALIKGVKRTQGMMIAKGNPKNITSIKDLTRADIVFLNRQRKSEIRILFDYLLKKNAIDEKKIEGYSREVNTPMMLASAVKSGLCDVGLGVLSVANMLDLDFIPIMDEEYDFVVLKSYLNDKMVHTFIKALKSKEFELDLNKLDDYSIVNPGSIVEID